METPKAQLARALVETVQENLNFHHQEVSENKTEASSDIHIAVPLDDTNGSPRENQQKKRINKNKSPRDDKVETPRGSKAGTPRETKSVYHEKCTAEEVVTEKKKFTKGPNGFGMGIDDDASRLAALDEHVKRFSFGKNPHKGWPSFPNKTPFSFSLLK